MNKNKIIIATDYFPPDPNNRSRRMYERAKYLADQGCSVKVFCPPQAAGSGETTTGTVYPGIEVIRVEPWFHSRFEGLNYWELNEFSGNIFASFFKPFLGYPRWIIPAMREIGKHGPQDAVLYTMNNPISLHILGLLLKRKVKNWIVELRDPITDYEYSKRGSLGNYLDNVVEHLIVKFADVVTLRVGLQTKPGTLKRKYASEAPKIRALPDYGVNLEDFKHLSGNNSRGSNKSLKGIYAGNLYGSEPVQALQKALERVNEHKNLAACVEVYGVSGHSTPFLKYRGRVPYWDLLDCYEDADFSLVFDNSEESGGEEGFIPSKLSELIALRKPILFVGNRESETARIISSNNIGVISKDSLGEIEKGIRRIGKMLTENTFNEAFYEEVKEEISNENCEKKFYELVDGLF